MSKHPPWNLDAGLVLQLCKLLLCLNSGLLLVPVVGEVRNSMHFRLFHRSELGLRHSAGEANDKGYSLRYMMDAAARDLLRSERMSSMIASSSKRTTVELDADKGNVSFSAPISSGGYAGEYFVTLHLGTPPREVVLVADTGNDMTRIRCSLDGRLPPPGDPRLFPAKNSTSFVEIQCSSSTCKKPLPSTPTACPSPTSPCLYDYRYLDGAFSRGIYATETVTVSDRKGSVFQVQEVIIGCCTESDGIAYGGSDGVLGLGQSATSFTIKASEITGGKFSYCLVNHISAPDVGNYLVFGENPQIASIYWGFRYTPLVLPPNIHPVYGVIVQSISIDYRKLPIPDTAWNFKWFEGSLTNGVIIDSATTLTSLVKPAYDEVMAAFEGYYANIQKFESPPFRLCFNETNMMGKALGPPMVIQLAGDVPFSPPVDNYIIPLAGGTRCVGILPVESPGLSVIGNILQQNHLWEFDVINTKLGFAPSSCVDQKS